MYPEKSDEEYATKEARKSRLPLIEQDKVIAELQEAVSVLLDRLQPVLTPTEPVEKMAEDRAVPIQSEIASTLSDNNSRIRRMSSRLNNAIERLEV